MRRLIHIVGALIALGATPVFAQSSGGGGGSAGGGAAGGSAASAVGGNSTGGSVGQPGVSPTGLTPSGLANTGQPGMSANVNGNINNPAVAATPASGGAVSGTAANAGTQSMAPSGAGATAPTQADTIAQRQQAAGVAAPATTQQGEEATLDQLDQKLEATSGVAPRCPPTAANCPRQ